MEFCVLVDWIDGSVEDTSELRVTAENERDAILFAIADWHQEAQQWPHCRITRVWIPEPEESASLPFPENLKVFPGSECSENPCGKQWGDSSSHQ